MLKRYKLKDYDFGLVIMLIAISVIGVLAVGSARASVQDRQIIGLILGGIPMLLNKIKKEKFKVSGFIISVITFTLVISFALLKV